MEDYKYCPQCGAEYNPDIDKCVDCGIELVGRQNLEACSPAEQPPIPLTKEAKHFITLTRFFLIFAILIIMAAIVIPNLLENKTAPGRAVVVVYLHQIYMAQRDHFNEHGRYALLHELRDKGLLDERAASGGAYGCKWEIQSFGSENWSVVAWPENPEEMEWYSFYVDETGILRGRDCPTKDTPLADKSSEARENFSEQPDCWAR